MSTKVELGEEIALPRLGTTIVKASCKGESGRWACVTHQEFLQHNWAMQHHIYEPGEHRLVYVCFEHGPEVP